MMSKLVAYRTIVLFAVIAALQVVLYRELLINDPLLLRDDNITVAPLEQVYSLQDYVEGRRSHKIIDVLPVRDFSFYMDYAIKRKFEISTFHATNLLLWIGILFLVYVIANLLYSQHALVLKCVLIFSVHPVFVGSVAWVSARKHLLSCFFILSATYWLIKCVKKEMSGFTKAFTAITLLYALSVFSHPITLLWPLWALLYVHLEASPSSKKRMLALLPACVAIMVLCAVLNYQYYAGPYVDFAGLTKLSNSPDATFGMTLLAWGRYFANLVAPFKITIEYYPGSPLNVVGLLLLLIFLLVLWKAVPRKQFIIWVAYFFFPLVPVTLRMTNIFVSDTYVLVPAFGLLNLVVLLASGSNVSHRFSLIATVAIVSVFVAASSRLTSSWSSNLNLWEHAFNTEKTPNVLFVRATQLLASDRAEEALELASWLKEWDPHSSKAHAVWAQSIYDSKRLNGAEKIKELEAKGASWSGPNYYLGLLYGERRDYSKAFNLIAPHFFSSRDYKADVERVAARAYFFCAKARAKHCHQFIAAVKQEYSSTWSGSAFQRLTAALGTPYKE